MKKIVVLLVLLLAVAFADEVKGIERCSDKTFSLNCEACSRVKCLKCIPSYKLVGEKCQLQTCTDANCRSCPKSTSACDQCKLGYKIGSSGCQKLNCGDNCKACASTTKCMTCYEGYSSSNGLCTKTQ